MFTHNLCIFIIALGIALDKLAKIQKAIKYTIINVSTIPYKPTILAALNVILKIFCNWNNWLIIYVFFCSLKPYIV